MGSDSGSEAPSHVITSSVHNKPSVYDDEQSSKKHGMDSVRSSFRNSLSSSVRGSFTAMKNSALGKVLSPRGDKNSPSIEVRPARRGLLGCMCVSDTVPAIGQVLTMDDSIINMKPDFIPDDPLLPEMDEELSNRATLVLDLDETLVHSTFAPTDEADYSIPLDMGGETHTVHVKKRPGVEHFLKVVSQWYEVVVFTASLSLYANPVIDRLDPTHTVRHRLFREHCVYVGGNYIKDLSLLGRDVKRVIIIDNSPITYALQPENAIASVSWVNDMEDRQLDEFIETLDRAKNLKDVRNARV
eukprot:Plantae.Rhodophyta-Rhodochaete_pulchella.ctg1119.p1 GENE.Plantae.Rhodophyta-Rhodochaete_pulchella.ctg1119~~Plantae.Rhodophyta-Rhodochaete_pulchella.ctg1119.p1  ORF type:complete len:300 (+),score=36.75 Plantae.Rhodophyta-Rhodochaete_pulchella.ctg1119:1547-2446(+)